MAGISAHCLHLICVSPLPYLAMGSMVALIEPPRPICHSVLSLNMSEVDTAPEMAGTGTMTGDGGGDLLQIPQRLSVWG